MEFIHKKLFTTDANGKKKRTKAGYDSLFENLMRYSNFKNVNQFGKETFEQDLTRFLEQVGENAESKGRKNNFKAKEFKELMGESLIRLQKDESASRRVFSTEKERVLQGKRFRGYKEAFAYGLVTNNEKGKLVFKSEVTIRKKKREIFRDKKGRFAAKPVFTVEGDE